MINEIIGINKKFFEWTESGEWITTSNYIDYQVVVEGQTLFLKFKASDDPNNINGLTDWIRNIRTFFKYWLAFKCLIHKGFLKGYKDSFFNVNGSILDAIEKNYINKIVVSGVSQGSAIALLWYALLKASYDKTYVDVQCYAFAPPRVVWCLLSWNIKKCLKDANLIIAYGDPVSHLPPILFGYRHIGKKTMIGDPKNNLDFAHHKPVNFITYLPD